MGTPTFSTRRLALTFLAVLAGLGLWSALSGTPPGEMHLVPCPVLAATGVPCPGCGMTRACWTLARGDLGAAWGHHPFVFLLVALAAAVGFWPRATARAWARAPRHLRNIGLGLTLSACLALWIVRLGA